ncbi:MAG: succinate dehydrogenase assembly factor 2 [Aeromonadaceae bacterium]
MNEQSLSHKEWDALRWQCRRGMLELDGILLPFVEEELPTLPLALQHDFIRLLQASDLELFRWLLRGAEPADPALLHLLEVILASHQARLSR